MKQRIVLAGLLAAGACAGPVVAEAPAQNIAVVNAQFIPLPMGQFQYFWAPASVAVTARGTVTFNNPTPVAHNVVVGGEAPRVLPVGGSTNWVAPATAGGVGFFCTLHPATMQGGIAVTAAPAPPPGQTPQGQTPPGQTPPAATPPATGPDAVAPVLSRVATSRRTWKVTVSFELTEDATVTARLKTRNGSRTLRKVERDLEAGRRSVTISRSLTPGTRYRVLLDVVDDAGNLSRRTVNFTGARR